MLELLLLLCKFSDCEIAWLHLMDVADTKAIDFACQ